MLLLGEVMAEHTADELLEMVRNAMASEATVMLDRKLFHALDARCKVGDLPEEWSINIVRMNVDEVELTKRIAELEAERDRRDELKTLLGHSLDREEELRKSLRRRNEQLAGERITALEVVVEAAQEFVDAEPEIAFVREGGEENKLAVAFANLKRRIAELPKNQPAEDECEST